MGNIVDVVGNINDVLGYNVPTTSILTHDINMYPRHQSCRGYAPHDMYPRYQNDIHDIKMLPTIRTHDTITSWVHLIDVVGWLMSWGTRLMSWVISDFTMLYDLYSSSPEVGKSGISIIVNFSTGSEFYRCISVRISNTRNTVSHEHPKSLLVK